MAEIIDAVDRALAMLIYMARQGQELGVSKIAADMGIYKSTAFRTLVTLEGRGFVERNPATERYRLGRRLFTLGKSVENDMGLQELARPYAKKLSEAYRETVSISVLVRDPGELYRCVVILKEESRHSSLRGTPMVGAERECHCSSVGKCLLAFTPGVDLSIYGRRPMEAHTQRTITSREALKSELDKVKLEGFAVDREELAPDLTCIAAPILTGKGEAVAAISLSGATERMMDGDIEERVEAVRRAAREIGMGLDAPKAP